MQARAGFTLVELVVALTLLTVGLLGWIGAGGMMLRMHAASERDVDGAMRARARAERTAGLACDAMRGGSMRDGAGVDERWEVRALANGVRLVHAEATYGTRRGPRTASYDVMAVCE